MQLAVFVAVLVVFYVFLKFITQERAPASEGSLSNPSPVYSLGRLASDSANTLSIHAASAGRENG